jgi:hypothetical protein
MFGQGRPNFMRKQTGICLVDSDLNRRQFAAPTRALFASLRNGITTLIVVLAIGLYCTGMAIAQSNLSQPNPAAFSQTEMSSFEELNFRFAWGGGTATRWQGTIAVADGSFQKSRVLAITSDAPSTVLLKGGSLKIQHRIATNYGGVDAELLCAKGTRVRVQISSLDLTRTFERTWTLAELSAGINEAIDDEQNRLSITRVPGDKVRVDVRRKNLVFETGERWAFSFNPQRCGIINAKLDARLSLTSPTKTQIQSKTQTSPFWEQQTQFTTDESGSAIPQSVELRLPQQEGVYDLWIEIEPPRGVPMFGQLSKPKSLKRCVQLVVVSPEPAMKSNDAWSTRQQFTAQQLKGTMRSSWPLANFSGTDFPVRFGKMEIGGGSSGCLELSPDAWVAVPIRRDKDAGVSRSDAAPLRITIQYKREPGTKLGINFISKNNEVLFGMDSGIAVPRLDPNTRRDPSEMREHIVHVWPETNDGYLLISNVDRDVVASIGGVKIESGPNRLASTNDLSNDSEYDEVPESRKRMALLESPDFATIFQATRSPDAESGQALDDWQTFVSGIDRLIQHLQLNRYDGAFVTVAADGSAMFPNAQLGAGPRFDSGTFSSSGRDPIQKDVLELMLRMFDREGLKLVPMLALNSTLPSMEMLRSGNRVQSFDLVDVDGGKADISRRYLPIYNPLDRNLQGAQAEIVEAISRRCRDHRSFAGIALACRPDCSTLLPGTRFGYDDVTIARFLQTVDVNPADFMTSELLKTLREPWLRWRSQQMAAWYESVASKVCFDVEAHQLYLLPIDIYRNVELGSSLSPSLHGGIDFSEVMQTVGLDSISQNKGVSLLAPQRVAPVRTMAERRIDMNVHQLGTADQFFLNRTAGSVFSHRGRWSKIESIEAIPGFDKKPRTRLRQLSVAGDANRRRYIEALRKYDSRLFVDGGYSLATGQDASLDSFSQILRRLPDEKFETVPGSSDGPVCMRQYSHDGQHWFYAVNDSPWPVEVVASLGTADSGASVIQATSRRNRPKSPLSTLVGKEISVEQASNGSTLRVFMGPWSVYAGTSVNNSSVNPYFIRDFEIELPENTDAQLRKRLYRLKSKLAKAKVGEPLNQLLNSSFESFANANESGWEFGNHDQTNFMLGSNDPHDGATSIVMKTDDKPVWMRSNRLSLPETGRLSISVWLKVDDSKQQPPLRLAIDGESDGESYYRFGAIGSLSPTSDANQLGTQWRRFAVHFDDLPIDLKDIRVGFDLMGTGSVSIDKVELFDRWFDENDSVAITQLLASAGSQLKNASTVDGGRRILESYWAQFLDQHIGHDVPPSVVQRPAESLSENVTSGFDFELPALPKFPGMDLPLKKPRRAPFFQRLQNRK